jgi:trehalose 6-phosphate synthase
VGALKREPTPPGPITDLFDRLHAIHLAAGLPSTRELATRIGQGVISSSTIHNMFRGPKVPRWGFLELVVDELQGDTAEFQSLWRAAQLSERAMGTALKYSKLCPILGDSIFRW